MRGDEREQHAVEQRGRRFEVCGNLRCGQTPTPNDAAQRRHERMAGGDEERHGFGQARAALRQPPREVLDDPPGVRFLAGPVGVVARVERSKECFDETSSLASERIPLTWGESQARPGQA